MVTVIGCLSVRQVTATLRLLNSDQYLHHRTMRIEEGLESLLEDVIHFDLVVDHGLDREQSTSDHVDDPWPHRDRVTERTLNSEVLDDPLERGDLDLSLHEADHDNDALGSDRVNTRIERSAVAGAFHRGIDANAFGRVLTNPIRNGFAGRIDEDRTDIEAFEFVADDWDWAR